MKQTKSIKTISRKTHTIDASGQSVGRLATKIATILRGKNKATFTPHVDNGDFVSVINASKVVLTGKKIEQKEYYAYSGYPGGLKTTTAKDLIITKPGELIKRAVYNMLPDVSKRNTIKRLTITN